MRRILLLAAVTAFGLTAHQDSDRAFANQTGRGDPSSPAVKPFQKTPSRGSLSKETPSHGSFTTTSSLQPVDSSLFWGDLTPGATAACMHSPGDTYRPSAPGLSEGELFPEPHACGGFHGDQMMAAAFFDTNLPVELQSWAVYLAKR